MIKNDSQAKDFDVIIIGSGMGGLTTGSLLAQLGGKRVLILERHFKLGGFTHSFRRKDYEWDVGVHYVGQMQAGSMTRRIMDLVTRGGVQWNPMGSPFERFVFPEGSFEVPDDPKLFLEKLRERFPDDAAAITRYFKDLRKVQGWIGRWFVAKQYSAPIARLLTMGSRKLVGMTTSEYLLRFKDPLLRAFLASQWPDYGSPPDESAFGFHATVAGDFLNGGYYPIGGSKVIATEMERAIESHGGKCLVSHEVVAINTHHGKACGVTVKHKGKETYYSSPVVVSNAGAITTFTKLVSPDFCETERRQALSLKRGVSAHILFLGLNDDPRKHGFDEANYWLYDRLDHDVHGRDREGKPPGVDGVFVSFGSLRNPGQEPHTAQVITFSQESRWGDFEGSKWKKRGDVYEQQKVDVSNEMLDFTEKYLPGLRKLVDYQELSTPLTIESFTGHAAGMVYGQTCDRNRLFRDQWKIKTSLPNLYLTGSDVGTPGVNGALMAGVMTAGKLLGPLGVPKIMSRAFMG
ncbi:MAG TPA: NAD(P)/FAD-dependent oxidoreductase [Planctomycetaceae bacterium]|nr:NAD(P)/FAD-dependent oxidoreductase [Planctomycetaceae bacterium]